MDRNSSFVLLRLSLAFRKGQVKSMARKILAQTLMNIIPLGLPAAEKDRADALRQYLPKDFADALMTVGFDLEWADGVDLIQSATVYAEMEEALALCAHIGSADTAITEHFMPLVNTPIRYEAWRYIQSLAVKDLDDFFKLFEQASSTVGQTIRANKIKELLSSPAPDSRDSAWANESPSNS